MTARQLPAPAADTLRSHPEESRPLSSAAQRERTPLPSEEGEAAADSAAKDRMREIGIPARPGADSLSAPDSLAAVAADSLAFAPDSLAGRQADTLRPLYRDTTATALFGPRTAATLRPAALPAAVAPAADPLLQGTVLLLAALYLLLLYRHAADIRLLLVRLTQDLRTENPHTAEPAGNRQSRLVRICSLLALLGTAIAAVHCLPVDLPAVLLLPAAAVLALAVVGYQQTVLLLAGAITLTRPFVGQLLRLRRTFLSLGMLAATPPLLLFALASAPRSGLWTTLCAAAVLLVLLLYLKKSVDLFLVKKVSILHWFLYLCIVEIFPFSLLWLLAVRG